MLSVKSLINRWNKKTDNYCSAYRYWCPCFYYKRDKNAYPQCGLFVYKRLLMFASKKQIM